MSIITIDPARLVVPVPQEVTMRQARLALHNAGMLAQVAPALDALEEPDKTTAMIEWEYSNAVKRDSVLVSQIGMVMGLDDSAMDDLFRAAGQL